MSHLPMVTIERACAAWRFDRSAIAGHSVRTDGKSVWSWGHLIGYTNTQSEKVAYCCHATQSTTIHSGQVQDEAKIVEPCPEHERNDLHMVWRDGVKVFVQRRGLERTDYGPSELCLEQGHYGTATAAWGENPKATCVYRCLRCNTWHSNFSGTYTPGTIADRRHPKGCDGNDNSDHQSRHDCYLCGTRVSLNVIQAIQDTWRTAKREWMVAYVAELHLENVRRPGFTTVEDWHPEEWRYTFVTARHGPSYPVICRKDDARGRKAADLVPVAAPA